MTEENESDNESPIPSPVRKQHSVIESPVSSQAPRPGSPDTPNLPVLSASPTEQPPHHPASPVGADMENMKQPQPTTPKETEKAVCKPAAQKGRRRSVKSKKETLAKSPKVCNIESEHAIPEHVGEVCPGVKTQNRRRSTVKKQVTVPELTEATVGPSNTEKDTSKENKANTVVKTAAKPIQKRKLLAMSDGLELAPELTEPTKASNTKQTKSVLFEPKKKVERGKKGSKGSVVAEKASAEPKKGQKRKNQDDSDQSDNMKIDKKKARISKQLEKHSTDEMSAPTNGDATKKTNKTKSVEITPTAEIVSKSDDVVTVKVVVPTRSSRRKSMICLPEQQEVHVKDQSVTTKTGRAQRRRSCLPSVSQVQECVQDGGQNTNEQNSVSFKKPHEKISAELKIGDCVTKSVENSQGSISDNRCPADIDTTADESMLQKTKRKKKKATVLKSSGQKDVVSSDSGTSDVSTTVSSALHTQSCSQANTSKVKPLLRGRKSIDEFNMSALKKKKTISVSLDSTDDDSDASIKTFSKPRSLKARSHSISCIASELEETRTEPTQQKRHKSAKENKRKTSSSASESDKEKKKSIRKSSLSDSGKRIPKPKKSLVVTSLHYE